MDALMTREKLIDEMLQTAKTIAVVGMSDKPSRASHNIAAYLSRNGYRPLKGLWSRSLTQ